VREIFGSINETLPMTEPPEYIWWPSSARLLYADCRVLIKIQKSLGLSAYQRLSRPSQSAILRVCRTA